MIKWEREAAVGCQKCWVATGECRIRWKFTQEPTTFTHWGRGPRACRDILLSLTRCCTTSMSPPRQSAPRKRRPGDELRSCASFKTEWAARTASAARNRVLLTRHARMAGPTALPSLWWLPASGAYLLLIWPFPCCFRHMVLKWGSWVQLTHAWGYPTWTQQVAKVTSQFPAFRADGLCLVSS